MDRARFAPVFAVALSISCGPTHTTDRAAPLTAQSSAAPSSHTDTAEPAQVPPTGLRLPDGVAPKRYALELALSPAADSFTGRVTIDIELAAPTRTLWLNEKDLEVQSATIASGGAEHAATVLTPGRDLLGFDAGTTLPAGTVTLRIDYRGQLPSHEEGGLFRRSEGGDWYIFSQLEATDARRVFPAFDDPRFKVPFELSLTVPETMVAVANTPTRRERADGKGQKRVEFEPTPPLPTYLLAMAVGPFDIVDAGTAGRNDTPLRVIVPRGRADRAAYAVASTKPILELLESYFDMPYPYRKLDQIAIPTFLGAMENPGLVTYHQELLLMDPADDTLRRQRGFANTCAHELAHMWFGDLVTMRWWNDVWLNESFATWMAARIVREWQPGWDGEVDAVKEAAFAMSSDALDSARIVRQPIETAHDIPAAFDGITYDKGASVLAMFEAWLGDDEFQQRVRAYIRAHALGTATGEDFLAALSVGGRPEVGVAFASFIDQPGVPLVRAELACKAGAPPTLALTQQRFLPYGSKANPDRTWKLPVCVEYGDGRKSARDCTLLTAASGSIELSGLGNRCPRWVLPNADVKGYYHVAYTAAQGEALLDSKALTGAERVGVLRDMTAQVKAGNIRRGTALAWAQRLARDKSVHVRRAAFALAWVPYDHLSEADEKRYASFVRRTFGREAHKLGFEVRKGDSEALRMFRPSLLAWVAIKGDDKVLKTQARTLAKRWLDDPAAVHPDLVDTVLEIAAHDGDIALWETLYARAKATGDTKIRGRMLDAMFHFRAPDIVERNLALVAGDELELNETLGLLYGALYNKDTRERGWQFVTENFDALLARLPKFFSRYIVNTGAFFCDAERLPDVERFFRQRIDSVPGGPVVLEQMLERQRLCIQSRALHEPSVVEFLQQY